MQNLHSLDKFRITAGPYGNPGDETCGSFWIPSPTDGAPLLVIASSDLGWDHVSVSRTSRCPNWVEMCRVKRLFFMSQETAMQLHVPEEDNINCHPYCLHLWRPQHLTIPRPPAVMVGPKPEEIK